MCKILTENCIDCKKTEREKERNHSGNTFNFTDKKELTIIKMKGQLTDPDLPEFNNTAIINWWHIAS